MYKNLKIQSKSIKFILNIHNLSFKLAKVQPLHTYSSTSSSSSSTFFGLRPKIPQLNQRNFFKCKAECMKHGNDQNVLQISLWKIIIYTMVPRFRNLQWYTCNNDIIAYFKPTNL